MSGSKPTQSMPDMHATRGLLGSGRYLTESILHPGHFRVQLPANLVLKLMHCGRWQRLGTIAPTTLERVTSPYPSATDDATLCTTQDCLWQATVDEIDAVIELLNPLKEDALCFRLRRILMSLSLSRREVHSSHQ